MKMISFVCGACTLMGGAEAASADFGAAGTKVVLGDVDLDAAWEKTEQPDGDSSTTKNVAIGFVGSYFVVDQVSVGVGLNVMYQSSEDASQSIVAAGVSGGYAVRLGERLHLWPQLSLSIGRASIESGSQEASASLSVGGAYVPVLYEPSEHLLLGVGPSVATTLHSSITFGGDTEDADKRTSVGIAGVLAGWF